MARLGFLASPTPKDLGGILNANALYSFSTGVFQIAIGFVILFTTQNQNVFVIMPLAVSLCSMLLSVANVLTNFSGLLNEIETEQRLADQIEQGSAAARAAEKKKHQTERDHALETLDMEFCTRTGPAAFCEQEERKRDIMNRYELKVQSAEDFNIEMLENELKTHRQRLQRTKEARKGKTTIDKNQQNKKGELQEFENSMKVFQEKKEQIQQEADDTISKIDPTKSSPEAFEEQIHSIEQDRDRKLKVIDDQIKKRKARFTGDAESAHPVSMDLP